MGSVAREEPVSLESGTVVTIRKWSVSKFFFALKLLGQAGSDVADKISVRMVRQKDPATGVESDRMVVDWNPKEVLGLLLNLSDQIQGKVTKLIQESIAETVTEEAILEWSPEDYLLVLAKILEQNLSEKLSKNLVNLRDTFLKQVQAKAK